MEFPVKISTVMSVYNTPVPFVKEAVENILGQTFHDFELIIIDDGSPDECAEYLDSLSDKRVRIIRNPENLGITKSLNIGFRAARGEYIARMDSDDISCPERFEKQLAFMESHPDVIVCGSRFVLIGQQPVLSTYIESMEHYRVRMLFTNPGPRHTTAFFDRKKLLQYQITYDEQLKYAQDYGMWMTASRYGRVCILPDVLVQIRIHPQRITDLHREEQIRCDKITQRKLLTKLLDSVTDEELDMHYFYSTGYFPRAVICPQIVSWYSRLLSANKQRKIYDQHELEQYTELCKRALIRQSWRLNRSIFKNLYLTFRFLSVPAIMRWGVQWFRRKIKL